MPSLYIIQQLTIYGGLFLFVTGIFGNGMNIFIFSSVRTYRRTPSSFYFLVGSIANFLYILINLTARILDGFYDIDLTNYSVIWCKLRNFSIGTFGLISFTCSCLAIIDQFFVTSRTLRLRRCNNIKWSHQIVFIVIIIWCLHGIPTCLYANIIPSRNKCTYTNPLYYRYVSVYAIIFLFTIPVPIMIIFGYLTYRNIRQTIVLAEQRADRQLVKMTLIQVVLVVISIIPFGITSTYLYITIGVVKDADRQMKEALVGAIVILISYLYYVGNFYIFLISSSRFRKTVKERLLWWRRPNEIHPF